MDDLWWIAFLGWAFGSTSSKKKKPTIVVPTPNLPIPNPNNPNQPPPSDEPVEPIDVEWIPSVPEPNKPTPPGIADITDDYPTDDRYYQVVEGDTGLGDGTHSITYRAIMQRAYLVAKEDGMDNAAALTWAKARANGANRLAYWKAIQCLPWNDRHYGTFGYGKQAWPGPNGRAIRLLPQHADNRALIGGQLAPVRSIQLRTPNDKGKGNGLAASGAPKGHLEFLFLPAIDADHLRTTGQVRTFSDGPPQWVRQLGTNDRSGAPAGIEWGC